MFWICNLQNVHTIGLLVLRLDQWVQIRSPAPTRTSTPAGSPRGSRAKPSSTARALGRYIRVELCCSTYISEIMIHHGLTHIFLVLIRGTRQDRETLNYALREEIVESLTLCVCCKPAGPEPGSMFVLQVCLAFQVSGQHPVVADRPEGREGRVWGLDSGPLRCRRVDH